MKSSFGYFLINFASPIVFYLTFHLAGQKPAIALSIGTTCIQLGVHLFYRLKLSPLFILTSGFTLGFGLIDLLIQNPRYFRLEPFAHNFLLGCLLLVTYFLKIPLITYFVEGLPKRLRPDLALISEGYLKKVTLVWSIYLLSKSALFLYIGLNTNLANLIVLRSLVGGGSLVLMFYGEYFYRKSKGARGARDD